MTVELCSIFTLNLAGRARNLARNRTDLFSFRLVHLISTIDLQDAYVPPQWLLGAKFGMGHRFRVTIFTLVLAVAWACSLIGMCLTPYWQCSAHWPSEFHDALIPGVLLTAVFLMIALTITLINVRLVKLVRPGTRIRRILVLFVIAAVVGTIPAIILHMVTGQGAGALIPQVEYLPFALPAAICALLLMCADRKFDLTKPDR